MSKKPSPTKSFWARNALLLTGVAAVLLLAGVLLLRESARPADTARTDANAITVYKRPGCQCCDKWVRHLQQAGFSVTVEPRADLDELRSHLGVPANYAGCHTAVTRGYVIEGHVPAADIQRLLIEHPAARGLAVPGMPVGSPGMEGPNSQPYEVSLLHTDGTANVFVRHDPRQHN